MSNKSQNRALIAFTSSLVFVPSALITLLCCGGVFTPKGEQRATSVSPASGDNATEQVPVVPVPVPETPKWTVKEVPDPMTDQVARLHFTESTTTVDFSFPYKGTQPMTLRMRQLGAKEDALIAMRRGQFSCSPSCDITLRFDDEPAFKVQGRRPADGSATMLFLSPAAKIRTKLRTAKTLQIQATFYRQGTYTFRFDVEGFEG